MGRLKPLVSIVLQRQTEKHVHTGEAALAARSGLEWDDAEFAALLAGTKPGSARKRRSRGVGV